MIKKHVFIQDPQSNLVSCFQCTNNGIKPEGTGYLDMHFFNIMTLATMEYQMFGAPIVLCGAPLCQDQSLKNT